MTGPTLFVYFDYQCPHCYLMTATLERVRLARRVAVRWRPVELYERAGLELGNQAADPALRVAELEALENAARLEGLPFRAPRYSIDTGRARQAIEFARDLGPDVFWRLHRALFRAYFGEGLDLGNPAILLSICEDAGVDRQALEEALSDGRYLEHLAAIDAEAETYGVDRLPTILVGRRRIVGAPPVDLLLDTIDRSVAEAGGAPA